jgi:hypothetical protein
MGKDILYKAFRNEKTDRTPWVPFVGCHGGKLIDVSSDKYLKSSELIVAGVSEAIHRYKPDGIPVAFDLQIEAECNLVSIQIKKAMEEMGKEFEIVLITDKRRIAAFGVLQTPAVILTEYKHKTEGEVPEVIVIKEWLKEI